ncbi:hypothetical protein KKF91_04180, partial [Myxococcota bacterium]|nr:hypothetical protein [Myxococcota bacterium]
LPAAEIQITSPSEGDVLASGSVAVTGTLKNASSATVNGVAATVNGQAFSATVVLADDETLIRAEAGEAFDEIHVVIDKRAPRIDILDPPRGTYVEPTTRDFHFTVNDTSLITQILFNGLNENTAQVPEILEPNIPLTGGLNVFQIEATDAANRTGYEHVCVLHGALQDPDLPIEGGIRLHIGRAALDAVEDTLAGVLMAQDLTALLGEGPHLDLGIFSVSVLGLTMPTPPEVMLTPNPASERVDLLIRLNEASLQLGVFITPDTPPIPFNVTARLIEITGALAIQIQAGQIVTQIEDLDIMVDDIRVTGSTPPAFPQDQEAQENLIEEIINGVLTVVLEQQLEGLFDGLLGALDDPIDLTLLGAQLRLTLTPDTISYGEGSISARIDVGVSLLNPPASAPPLAGYPGTPSLWMGVPVTDQLALVVDDDIITLLLYQLWRAGVLLPTIDAAFLAEYQELAILTTLLGSKLAGAIPGFQVGTPLALDIDLPLPIVTRVIEAEGKAGLRLSIGDMLMHIMRADDNTAIIDGAATLEIDAVLGVAQAEDGALKLDLDVVRNLTLFDVVTEAYRGAVEEKLEPDMGDLLSTIGTLLPGLVSNLPLPVIPYVSLGDVRVARTGPDEDFIAVFVDLVAP